VIPALTIVIFALIAAAVAAMLHRGKARNGEARVESILGGTAGPLLKHQFLQAQRMEALGRLTGGVAHDFNNILTIVKGCAEMAIAHVDDTNPARKDLDEIRKAADTGVALTRQLLTFSRKNPASPVAISINEVVRPLAEMLRRLVGEHIDFITHFEGDAGRVLVDPVLIEQVVMNLVVNARDAMPGGGTLTVHTAGATLGAKFARSHKLGRAGAFVSVAVADTGHGLTADERARIFEPFFTTKGPGQGTGLGLATVHSIVHDAGGCVVVDSTPGRGTTFTVYLPRVDSVRGRSPRSLSAGFVQPPTAQMVEV
jgi:two-component system, cell cycle sensor histidine kinase and response regulator CckA